MVSKEEQRGAAGFALHKKISENEKTRRFLMISNIKALKRIFEEDLYKEILGDEGADWSSYLAQPDVYYTRHQVKQLIEIYDKFEGELDIDLGSIFDVPQTRLGSLVKFVTKDNYEEHLEAARNYTPHHWRVHIRELEGKPNEDDCKHDYQNFRICRICGGKCKV